MYSKKYSSDNTSKIEQEQSNQIFRYGNKIVDYTLIKSKRRKTSEIIVDKNSSIILRVPFEKTISELMCWKNDTAREDVTEKTFIDLAKLCTNYMITDFQALLKNEKDAPKEYAVSYLEKTYAEKSK